LLPYTISLGISVLVGVYCLLRGNVPGARPYGWLAFAQAVWVWAFIFRWISPSLDEKIIWANIEWLATFFIPYTYPIFTAQFIGLEPARIKILRVILGIVPIGMTVLVLTDPYHHLIYPNPHIVPGTPFAQLAYDFTPLVQAFGTYSLLVILGTIVVLSVRFVRPRNLYRSQVLAVIIASLVPTVATVLALTHITEIDMTPLTFILRNLVVIWALSRYRLFEIVPIARDTIIENINDPVIVLDVENQVVDVNRAAAAGIGSPPSELIGRSLETVFAAWPELAQQFKDVTQTKTQVAARVNGRMQYYSLTISPLYDHRKRFIGRVFVSREITEQVRLDRRLQRLNNGLDARVHQRTSELAQAYDTTLQGWARALEFRDKETAGHSQRVTDLTMKLAVALGLPEDELVHIRRGALLHDIGKMAIPDEILRKGTDLTPAEREIVSKHPEIAHELLAPIPYLEKALEIPYCHHERWDGTGYPRGLKGEQIPLSARIFAVADVWDSLRSDQPYRQAWPRKETIRYMEEQAGTSFDPAVLGVFLDLMEQGKF